jgi:ABC-type transporter Mla subunit MlaD
MRDIKQIASEINTKCPDIADQMNELIKLYEDHLAFAEELRKALSESTSYYHKSVEVVNDLTKTVQRYEKIIDKLLE